MDFYFECREQERHTRQKKRNEQNIILYKKKIILYLLQRSYGNMIRFVCISFYQLKCIHTQLGLTRAPPLFKSHQIVNIFLNIIVYLCLTFSFRLNLFFFSFYFGIQLIRWRCVVCVAFFFYYFPSSFPFDTMYIYKRANWIQLHLFTNTPEP